MATRTPPLSCAAALALLTVGCHAGTAGPKGGGQSGSEFMQDEGPGGRVDVGVPNSAMYPPCPCERFAGRPPLVGTVESWSDTLLTFTVDAIAVDQPPADAPQVGSRVTGTYHGILPCYAGYYTPEPGDRVVAYLFPEEQQWGPCCEDLGCEETCFALEVEQQDPCLAECQDAMRAPCEERHAQIELAGGVYAAPLADDGTLTLGSSEHGDFTASQSQLEAIFAGGDSCAQTVGRVRDWQAAINAQWSYAVDAGEGDEEGGLHIPVVLGASSNWRASCQ